MRRVALATLVTFLILAATLGVPGAQSTQRVTFALNWFAVGDHAAYWVALEKGYYRARGLDVELQNSKGSGDSIAKVDTGRADIGLADAIGMDLRRVSELLANFVLNRPALDDLKLRRDVSRRIAARARRRVK